MVSVHQWQWASGHVKTHLKYHTSWLNKVILATAYTKHLSQQCRCYAFSNALFRTWVPFCCIWCCEKSSQDVQFYTKFAVNSIIKPLTSRNQVHWTFQEPSTLPFQPLTLRQTCMVLCFVLFLSAWSLCFPFHVLKPMNDRTLNVVELVTKQSHSQVVIVRVLAISLNSRSLSL